MKQSKNILTDKEMELVSLLMQDCKSTNDIQAKLKRLFAGTIEQMLEAEMDEHLGYEKHDNSGDNTGNSRNGYNHKTIISEYGESEIAVPRDRNGEFEPKVIAKRQTRTDEIEQKIMAMYAKGMSQRDIEDNLREIYGAEIPQSLISKITDKILPEVNEWQNRPLESIYPIVYFDGIVFKSRKDSQIINKCVYTVLGIGFPRRVIVVHKQNKKRATPVGITLLAKPRRALGSVSTVALSSLRVKAVRVYHPVITESMYNLRAEAVQLPRRHCLTSPP